MPVFSNIEGKVSARYVRTYVEAGEAAAGCPMGAAELAVLDHFEEVTKRPELMLEFTLQPGEIYFINNYTILHARTAFEDARRRTGAASVAAMARSAQMRPVHPHIRERHRGGARPHAVLRLEHADQEPQLTTALGREDRP